MPRNRPQNAKKGTLFPRGERAYLPGIAFQRVKSGQNRGEKGPSNPQKHRLPAGLYRIFYGKKGDLSRLPHSLPYTCFLCLRIERRYRRMTRRGAVQKLYCAPIGVKWICFAYRLSPKTCRPPRKVAQTGTSLMVWGSTSKRLAPSTTKSASIPGWMRPLTFSSKEAVADSMV